MVPFVDAMAQASSAMLPSFFNAVFIGGSFCSAYGATAGV